jgi:hypothetical protein
MLLIVLIRVSNCGEPNLGAACLLPAGVAVEVLLDRTPFYAESGGQVADTGYLRGSSSSSEEASSSSTSDLLLEVSDVQKGAGGRLFVHSATLKQGSIRVGQQVRRWLAADGSVVRWGAGSCAGRARVVPELSNPGSKQRVLRS